jgi:hypothetical protein
MAKRWALGLAAFLALAGAAGLTARARILGAAEQAAWQGLEWQARLGLVPYVPAAQHLVELGSQADLLARYLVAMDQTAEAAAHLEPMNARLVAWKVWQSQLGLSGGYVEYWVREARTFRVQGRVSTATVTGLVTLWVNPAPNGGGWVVTGLSYNFDPMQLPGAPDSFSYLTARLSAQNSLPLGVFGP